MEDREIVNLYLGRIETAISETKNKYSRYILKIAMNVLDSVSDAEECENDTYLAAWNSIPPQVPVNLKLFLGRITRNLSISLFRKNKAQKRGCGMEVLLSELSECAPFEPGDVRFGSPDDELGVKELTECINNFLYAQTEEKRIIFVKRYWFGESIADISSAMGISESKTGAVLCRLRAKLKKVLEKEGVAL